MHSAKGLKGKESAQLQGFQIGTPHRFMVFEAGGTKGNNGLQREGDTGPRGRGHQSVQSKGKPLILNFQMINAVLVPLL